MTDSLDCAHTVTVTTTHNTRPTHLTGTVEDVRRRMEIMLDAENTSAISCVVDAEHAFAHALAHDAFPFPVSESSPLPMTWLESTLAWLDRSAAHEFGFNRPASW